MKAGMVSDTVLVQCFIQVVLGEAQHLEWACRCAWSGNMHRWLFCGSGCGHAWLWDMGHVEDWETCMTWDMWDWRPNNGIGMQDSGL